MHAACAVRPADPLPVGPGGAEALANPFAPATMQVHPLTRVERDTQGKLWIVCHVEFKDAWGDTTKGIGQLEVQLYRAGAGPFAADETQETRWPIDLSDLKNNAALYDSPTRTYRLPLKDPPEWVGGTGEEGKDKPRVRLRAVLSTKGPAGERRVLQDEYVINE